LLIHGHVVQVALQSLRRVGKAKPNDAQKMHSLTKKTSFSPILISLNFVLGFSSWLMIFSDGRKHSSGIPFLRMCGGAPMVVLSRCAARRMIEQGLCALTHGAVRPARL
jgi:hypothetical protein